MQIGGPILSLRSEKFTIEFIVPELSFSRHGFRMQADTTLERIKTVGGIARIHDIMLLGFGVSIIYRTN